MTMTLEPESPSVAAEAPGKGLRWVVVLLVLVLGVAAGVEIHLRRKEARVDALLDEIDHELERLIETDPDGAANAVDELSPKFNAVMGLIAELEAMREYRSWTRTSFGIGNEHHGFLLTLMLQFAVETGNTRLEAFRQSRTGIEREAALRALEDHISSMKGAAEAVNGEAFLLNAESLEFQVQQIRGSWSEVQAKPASAATTGSGD